MSITSTHPQYSKFLPDWTLMRDSWDGERAIKDKGRQYLPATPGQEFDGLSVGQRGFQNYQSYKERARFHDFVCQAVEALVGIMHHKPPRIELPAAMEPLMESATVKGEPLDVLLRRINVEQLITGRLGLLADVLDGSPAGTLPYIALYRAEDVINWDDGTRDELVLQNLNLVVIDESENERTDRFEWEFETKHRVLALGDVEDNEGVGVYRAGVFRGQDAQFSEAGLVTPAISGRTLSQIPFVFVNAKDIVPDPDNPPLLGLARLGITVYRGEADYRQTLFMQGQDTLVIIGGTDSEDEDTRAGAGATIDVPMGGNAKYIGVSSDGLAEQREALQNDKMEAAEIGGKLLDSRGREAESGDALRIRVSARTASLNQIALAGAEGLKTILRIMATWVGANPEDVVVEPNQDFADDSLDGRTLVDIMTAKTMGAPLSARSVHRLMREKDMTEMEFEEEVVEIESEAPLSGGTGEADEAQADGGDPPADDETGDETGT